MRRHLLPVLLILPFFPTATLAQQSGTAIAGCYRIVQGEWDSRLQPGFHPSPRYLPAAIQFDTLPLIGWPMKYLEGARRARSLSPPSDSSYQFTYWQPLEDDSILVDTPLPFSGFSMKLARTGTRLEGRVTSFTDVLREDPPSEVSAPVVLKRIECP